MRPSELCVAHVLPAASDAGGVATLVQGLHEAAAEVGVRSRVVEATLLGRALPGLPLLAPTRATRSGLAQQVGDADVVVVHGVFQPAVAQLRRWVRRRLPGTPLVCFPHDAYDVGLFGSRTLRKRAYFALVEGPALRDCDLVVTTAPSHERWLRGRGVQTPVLMHAAGLGAEGHQRAVEVRRARAAGRRPGPLRLLQLGRWDVEEKGLDVSVRAFAGRAGPSAELRLVGPPEDGRAAVHALAAGVTGVRLVGFVDDPWTELQDADLLVMPSRKEGFGLAALEALSCGVPVLLSTRAGFAEHAGRQDGVVTCAPEAAAWTGALEQAVDQLPELTAAARRFGDERAAGFTTAALLSALLQRWR